MKSGIYLIKNTINNKVYIGSAINIDKRWREHKYFLKERNHHSCLLQRAWDKYGEQSFKFEIIQEVPNPEHILAYEQVYLDYYKSYESERGYNICKVAGSSLGTKHSEEAKKKISETHKGKIVSEETRKKMSEAKRNISEETRKKISEGNKGKNLGKKHNEETKIKIGQASSNKKHSEEAKRKIGEAHKSKIVSEETRRKMSGACLTITC